MIRNPYYGYFCSMYISRNVFHYDFPSVQNIFTLSDRQVKSV